MSVWFPPPMVAQQGFKARTHSFVDTAPQAATFSDGSNRNTGSQKPSARRSSREVQLEMLRGGKQRSGVLSGTI